jgi:long-chain fatty acid transport protein
VRKILLSLALLPSLALASGYSLPNTNPRDLALSASAVAAQSDSGAAFAMPASLSRIEGPAARLSAGGVTIFNTWSDPTGASADVDMDKQVTPIGNLSVAYGLRLPALGDRGLGVGFGIQPFGGAVVKWPENWPGRYRIVEVDRRVFSGILSAGIEVVPRVRLGGGLVYYYTTEELSQNVWMAPFAGASPADIANPATWNTALPDAVGTIDASGGAFSFDVSAEVQPLPNLPLTIAVDYKHKATQDLDGDAEWQNLTPLAAALGQAGAAPFLNQGAGQQLTVPNVLNIGLAYRVTEPLLLTFTYTFDRWMVYDTDTFVADNGQTISVERDYSNGFTLRAGAEYDVSKQFTVRAGVQRDESGLDEKFYSPTLPDSSSWAGSLGATYRFGGGLAVDAAVFYAIMDEVTAEDPNPATPGVGIEPQLNPPVVAVSPEGTFRGTYDVSALIFGVGVSWTPGAR